MNIQKITYQYRRDFQAVYECQFCGETMKAGGYDDAFFHNEVIPKMRCEKCHKSVENDGSELDEHYRGLSPKYPEGYDI